MSIDLSRKTFTFFQFFFTNFYVRRHHSLYYPHPTSRSLLAIALLGLIVYDLIQKFRQHLIHMLIIKLTCPDRFMTAAAIL